MAETIRVIGAVAMSERVALEREADPRCVIHLEDLGDNVFEIVVTPSEDKDGEADLRTPADRGGRHSVW